MVHHLQLLYSVSNYFSDHVFILFIVIVALIIILIVIISFYRKKLTKNYGMDVDNRSINNPAYAETIMMTENKNDQVQDDDDDDTYEKMK